ncbi:hypothetical protein JCM3765_005465 [Sporobolomyces pararoseus]
MRLRTTLIASCLFVSLAYAAKTPPRTPTTIEEVPNPLPAEPPQQPDSSIHYSQILSDSDPDSDELLEFDFSSARILPAHSTPAPSVRTITLGPTYKLGPLKLKPKEFKIELITILVLIPLYLISFLLIRSKNHQTHSRFYSTIETILRKEFAGVGFGIEKEWFKYENSLGKDESVCYCSGRRGIESCWINVKSNSGGYDLLSKSWFLVRKSLEPGFEDSGSKVVIEFKLEPSKGTPGFKQSCFSILKRDKLQIISSQRWDLKTFTQLQETSVLDPSLILMSESNDLTNSLLLLDAKTGLKEMFQPQQQGKNEGVLEVFESLILSDFGLKGDQPDIEKNITISNQLYLILTLRLPSTPSEITDQGIRDLFTMSCNLGDFIHSKEKLLPSIQILKSSQRRSNVIEALVAKKQKEESDNSTTTTTTPTPQVKKRKIKTRTR